jgi:hypothetical protein
MSDKPQHEEPEFFEINGEKLPLKGVLGVRQVDETTVEVRYAGPTYHVKGTSSQVLSKLRKAKGINLPLR